MAMQIFHVTGRSLKWIAIVVAIILSQLLAYTIANADALSEAIANQNSIEQIGAVSGGAAHGTNVAEVNVPMTKPQSDFDSSIGPRTMKEVVRKISESLDKLESSTTIANASESILTMLVALLLASALVKSMFSGGFNQFIEAGIHTFLMWGIAYAMLNVGGIQGISGFIDSLASILNGGNMSNLNDALSTTIDKTFSSLASVLSMPSGNSSYKLSEELDWVPLLVVTIVQLLAKMIAGFLIIIAFIIYACNIVISFASIILAKSFAPIMIPFILIPSTAFIFNGWLKFFISALLVKCVGAFFIKICDSIINSIQTVAQSVYVAPDVDGMSLVTANFVVYVCLVGMAGLAAYLMTMVPSIANGLMSGSSVGSGFKGLGVITNGVAIRGGHRATDASVRATWKTLKWTGKKSVSVTHKIVQAMKYRNNTIPGAGGTGRPVTPGVGGAGQPSHPSFGVGSQGGGGGMGGQNGMVYIGRQGNAPPMPGRKRGGHGGSGAAGGGSGSPPSSSSPSTASNSSSGTP